MRPGKTRHTWPVGSARTPSLRVLIGAAAVLTAAGGTGAAFVAVLLTNAPLVLIAVSPLYRHLVLTATVVDFVPFALVAVPARLLGSVVGYMWGLGYGERSLVWVEQRRPRWGRWLRVLEKVVTVRSFTTERTFSTCDTSCSTAWRSCALGTSPVSRAWRL